MDFSKVGFTSRNEHWHGVSSLPLLCERVFSSTHMIEPNKLSTIATVIANKALSVDGDLLASEIKESRSSRSGKIQIVENVAIIPVLGTTLHRGGYINGQSGLTSYDGLRGQVLEAYQDKSVDAIIMDIDSGGGEAAGCFEFCKFLKEVSAEKPVYAYVNESAFSAAYAIASACTEIFMPETGNVGSIGVYRVHMDRSDRDKAEGVKLTPIVGGTNKLAEWQHAPLSDEAKARAQNDIDRMYSLFVKLVAHNRGMSVDAVRQTNAEIFNAEDALKLKLADGIASFDEIINLVITNS